MIESESQKQRLGDEWLEERPKVEGWYLHTGRSIRSYRDPWLWDAYYVMIDLDEILLWRDGVNVNWPKAGAWLPVYLPKITKTNSINRPHNE